MTQIYLEDEVIPVTVVEVPENIVCRIWTDQKGESYDIGILGRRNPTKADKGKYPKAKYVPRFLWTLKGQSEDLKEGDTFGADVFKEGDLADVTGITKAKGFAGVVKRWGFHGGQRTRGQSDRQRAPGSIGAGTDPGRVLPGKKMAGRMGGTRKMLRKRKVVGVGDGYILIKGAIPGNPGSLVYLTKVGGQDEN